MFSYSCVPKRDIHFESEMEIQFGQKGCNERMLTFHPLPFLSFKSKYINTCTIKRSYGIGAYYAHAQPNKRYIIVVPREGFD